jgi:hypothetical protein
MKSTLFACLLILQLSFSEHLVCLSDAPTTQLRLAQLPAKLNTRYNFELSFHAAPVTILRNSNGTFFQGDFSLLQLHKDNRTHVYRSTAFSFKYPPQHRIADVANEILELQIAYSLQENPQLAWKHKQLLLSISFMCSEYLPMERRTLGKLVNFGLKNGSQVDLGSALPLVSNMNVQLPSLRCSSIRERTQLTPLTPLHFGL